MNRHRLVGSSSRIRSRPAWQRYTLFQLPGIAIVGALATMGTNWLALPVWTIPLALATWIAKDVLLYPVLKTAYEGDKPVGQASMVGSLGTATEDLRPRGYVKIGPELWRAECSEAVRAGDAVRVKGCHGMTMLVEPVESETGRSR